MMNPPLSQAIAALHAEENRYGLTELVSAHFENGYVFSTPTVFILARPVFVDVELDSGEILNEREILNPRMVWGAGWNAWHVYLFSGDMREGLSYMPFPLEFLSFERKNRLRVYSLNYISQRLSTKQ